jgi:hypothetical protein
MEDVEDWRLFRGNFSFATPSLLIFLYFFFLKKVPLPPLPPLLLVRGCGGWMEDGWRMEDGIFHFLHRSAACTGVYRKVVQW